MTSSVIRATKRVVGFPKPEENVPVVSVADWARVQTENLGRRVRHLPLTFAPDDNQTLPRPLSTFQICFLS
jgi:hypothetical protein